MVSRRENVVFPELVGPAIRTIGASRGLHLLGDLGDVLLVQRLGHQHDLVHTPALDGIVQCAHVVDAQVLQPVAVQPERGQQLRIGRDRLQASSANAGAGNRSVNPPSAVTKSNHFRYPVEGTM